jgi:hypothetical protein
LYFKNNTAKTSLSLENRLGKNYHIAVKNKPHLKMKTEKLT